MSRIARLILNLSIGAKLGITSAFGILLVVAMLVSTMRANTTTREMDAHKTAQQTIARDAVDVKASIRGMQTGVRDVRLANSSADLQKANEYLAARLKSINQFADEMLQLAHSPENRARIEKIKTKALDYLKGGQQIAAVRTEAIGAAAAGADAAARVAKLNEEAGRIAREVTLPIAADLEATANKVVDFAKHRAEEVAAHPAGNGVRRKEVADYRHRTGAADDRNLRVFHLHDQPADAGLQRVDGRARRRQFRGGAARTRPQGRGRRVAGAVENFKVVAEQKARDEAEAKIKQDQIAAEQRKAEMIKLADSSKARSARSSRPCRRLRPNSKLPPHADGDRRTRPASHHDGRGGFRGSFRQCAVGGFRDRGTVVLGQRDQPAGPGIGADGQRGRRSGAQTNDRVSELSKAAAASATSSN